MYWLCCSFWDMYRLQATSLLQKCLLFIFYCVWCTITYMKHRSDTNTCANTTDLRNFGLITWPYNENTISKSIFINKNFHNSLVIGWRSMGVNPQLYLSEKIYFLCIPLNIWREEDAKMCRANEISFFFQVMTCSVPDHCLNECWLIVNWNVRDEFQQESKYG